MGRQIIYLRRYMRKGIYYRPFPGRRSGNPAGRRQVPPADPYDADSGAERTAQAPRRDDPGLGAGVEHPALAQEKGVRERRRDLLGVVGDEDKGRPGAPPCDAVEEPEKLLPCHRVEPGARLIEDE